MNFENINQLKQIKKEVIQEVTKLKNEKNNEKKNNNQQITNKILKFKWSGFAPQKFKYYKTNY